MQKKGLTILICIVVCVTVSYGVYIHMKGKIQISREDFFGTYSVKTGDDKRISIEGVNSDKISEKHDYVVFNQDGSKWLEGKCEIKKDNYIIMYKDNIPVATLFYTNEKFFYSESGKKCSEIEKTSDSAVFP